MSGYLLIDPDAKRGVVLRDQQRQSLLVSGRQGPPGRDGLGAATPQAANTVNAGPVDGANAVPTFRRLASQDLSGVVLDGGNF